MAQEERNPLNLVLEDFKLHLVSSAGFSKGESELDIEENKLKFADQETEEAEEIFEELEDEKLPPLPMKNRAQLQIQSPNRARFYWSLKSNPFQTLEKIVGSEAVKYKLVAKLINQTENTELLFPVDVAGSTWFDVEPDSTYRVEVGLFAPNKPFIRLLFSNTIQTPRSAPSPYFDWSPEFAVSTEEFVQILDATGFKQDAMELALAGDDSNSADNAIRNAFFSLFGQQSLTVKPSELRYALFALASGLLLEDLRGQISPSLYALLQKLIAENAENASSERIKAALAENFTSMEEPEEETKISYKTFGASLVEFRQRRPARKLPKLAPVSSLRY